MLPVAASSYAQQPRDNRTPPGSGDARLTGIVRDARDGRPLRRARVSVTGSELQMARVVITVDDGTFVFDGLPAGRFALSGSKDGHVSANHGAVRPGRPGRLITLNPGGAARVELRLPPGAVITGTVIAPDGEPMANVAVSAFIWKYDANRGERRLTGVANGTVATDDRGVYRIFGLAEGGYLVAALPRVMSGPGDVQLMSANEVRAALAEVRQSLVETRPGIPTSPPQRQTDVAEPRRSVTLAPVFFPGTPMQERATPVQLRAGEVRQAVNIDLDYMSTVLVEGLVTVPQGMRVQLQMMSSDPLGMSMGMRTSIASEDGRFSFRSVSPGTYSIVARAYPRDIRTGAMPSETGLWAETRVVVAGEDVAGISLTLLPALSISGRVILEGTDARLPELVSLRVPIPVFLVGGSSSMGVPSAVLDGSRFSIRGVLPGVYRFSSPPRGVRSPVGRWWLKSMTLNGKEALDSELELRESTDDAVITLSERASELSGEVRQAGGIPVTDGFVVVFSADPRFWFHNSRRVAGVRLTGDGKYVVRNLPAGDYLLAVTNDIEMNEWFDPEVLKGLVRNAARVALADNEVKALNLSPR